MRMRSPALCSQREYAGLTGTVRWRGGKWRGGTGPNRRRGRINMVGARCRGQCSIRASNTPACTARAIPAREALKTTPCARELSRASSLESATRAARAPAPPSGEPGLRHPGVDCGVAASGARAGVGTGQVESRARPAAGASAVASHFACTALSASRPVRGGRGRHVMAGLRGFRGGERYARTVDARGCRSLRWGVGIHRHLGDVHVHQLCLGVASLQR